MSSTAVVTIRGLVLEAGSFGHPDVEGRKPDLGWGMYSMSRRECTSEGTEIGVIGRQS
jgi:hypothetical protein